jgi:hypothetical protein
VTLTPGGTTPTTEPDVALAAHVAPTAPIGYGAFLAALDSAQRLALREPATRNLVHHLAQQLLITTTYAQVLDALAHYHAHHATTGCDHLRLATMLGAEALTTATPHDAYEAIRAFAATHRDTPVLELIANTPVSSGLAIRPLVRLAVQQIGDGFIRDGTIRASSAESSFFASASPRVFDLDTYELLFSHYGPPFAQYLVWAFHLARPDARAHQRELCEVLSPQWTSSLRDLCELIDALDPAASAVA